MWKGWTIFQLFCCIFAKSFLKMEQWGKALKKNKDKVHKIETISLVLIIRLNVQIYTK